MTNQPATLPHKHILFTLFNFQVAILYSHPSCELDFQIHLFVLFSFVKNHPTKQNNIEDMTSSQNPRERFLPLLLAVEYEMTCMMITIYL